MRKLKWNLFYFLIILFISIFTFGCAPGPPPPPIVGSTGFFMIGWIIIALIALIVVLLWRKNNNTEQQNEDKYIINSLNDINKRLKKLEETIENLIRNKNKME